MLEKDVVESSGSKKNILLLNALMRKEVKLNGVSNVLITRYQHHAYENQMTSSIVDWPTNLSETNQYVCLDLISQQS